MKIYFRRLFSLAIIAVFALGVFAGCGSTAKSLKDGEYSVEVSMTGGSGKASIASPAVLTVEGGVPSVELVWSSEYYDYMIVDGETYYNENEGGNSTFTIPLSDVTALDEPLTVIGDTTAMSQPHEIEYTLTFTVMEDDDEE